MREEPIESTTDTYRREQIVALLSASLGNETAERVVDQALGALFLDGARLSHARALAVLELVALQPGLVGIVARLAKARVRAGRMVQR